MELKQEFESVEEVMMKARDLEDLRCLLEKNPAFLSMRDNYGRTLLGWAAKLDQVATVDLLVSLGAPMELMSDALDLYGIPLMIGADNNHLEVVRRLLHHRADINTMDEENKTALHHAAQHQHIEMVQLLIRAGSSVNHQDKYGQTPLHIAGNAETVQVLLDAGASPSIQNKGGDTPLHVAVRQDVARQDVVMLLAPLSDLSLVGTGLSPLAEPCNGHLS